MNIEEGFKNLICLFETFLIDQGVNPTLALYLNLLLNILVLIMIIIGVNYLIKTFVIEAFKSFSNKTKTTFDDFLIQTNFPKYIGQILPLVIIYFTVPYILVDFPLAIKAFYFLIDIYIIFLIVWLIRSFLRTTKSYLRTLESFKDKPVESYIQVVMIIVWLFAFIFIIAEITGKDVLNFIISLGAASAILLLIFKDTILGFVASIQVSVNDIVRIGDWITFSKYGADGTVTEITLATVRVQNFDNTFTSIPTYSLISESFQNWRGMQESPGRRIKRSVFIKQNSVKFITPEDFEKYKNIQLISSYLDDRQNEINAYNTTNEIDKNLPLNGRNQTNLGIFRKYIDTYLNTHSAVHKEMYIIVRHLQPTEHGIPLEILCFSRDKRWENFEYITADIFDHIIAAVSYFDLQLFEAPSGDDIRDYFSKMNPESPKKEDE
ncbi:mechanosensitive ion channel protein MscS [Salegentibacter salinarum]|uniref:Mechanosensitive ion channel protein MscS n=1 Tax=Salegentibacter salinarum TaxID=447422 RepID=A0A2N0TMW3_9FLAO|nr:mechanosensitive ion channel domain-containing protein [Salegentibacter salinarum]PKD16077.1 mechanosensitive ion channel protein MscS [Salegentibacter salinarum]SKB69645.1 miniconductance mechanosensitive channel [Salegentibacter salinarum]